MAALAGFNLFAISMYINSKEWYIQFIEFSIDLYIDKTAEFIPTFKRSIHFLTAITEEQKEKLLEITIDH
jgi:hypothetical protein